MFSSFDISMLVLGMPFDGDTLETKSLGGSESAAIYMAKALANHGARVRVFCVTDSVSTDPEGVRYEPAATWPSFAAQTPHDVCIVQRAPEVLSQRTNARLNLLWCHDLALGRQEAAFRGALWNVNAIIVLSRFMREQYRAVHQLGEEAFLLSRNGVDLALFRQLADLGIRRDPKKLLYAARPERGLDVLLRDVMPKLLARDGDLRLYLAGYDVRPSPEWDDLYAECDRLVSQLGSHVVKLGCLTKRQLYKQYLSASVYVYPTPSLQAPSFREVSCIAAMECQAAGLPLVTTAIGALPETIDPGAGVLVNVDPSRPGDLLSYVDQFVEAVLGLVGDERRWSSASACGLSRARELDWSGVARQWLVEFERLIRDRNDSPERLVRHLWRTSDIVAARAVLADAAATSRMVPRQRDELAGLLRPWSFMDQPDGYRAQYERIYDRIGAELKATAREEPLQEPRFAHLQQWLSVRKHQIDTILDYGCSQGACAIALARRFPHLTIHGVNIARAAVNTATEDAQSVGVADRATFSVWTHDSPHLPRAAGQIAPGTFDCALVQEVLEHVPAPWAVLEAVERQVRPGGKLYVTVPFGPWEFAQYATQPLRSHIWHLDAHDLRDMFGAKPDVELTSIYAHDSPLTGEPQGWWIASYTADHRSVPPIDLQRHLWMQRPRQSVSGAIIAGPGSEEALHWTLRSIRDIVDETMLVDCGMTDEARRIAAQYDVTVIAGVDPKTEGFERARNLGLDRCSCDWCLWIDTDEKLVDCGALEKYLRENPYHGYGMRQHHFACDTTLPPDVPVRLFRRRPYQGRTVRFWGAIHEHPELALDEGPGPTIVLRDVHIAHVGYLIEGTRRARFYRNLPVLRLDEERYPERLLQKHMLMRDNMHMVRYILEQRGGRVDERARKLCRQTIDLYRKYFLGTPKYRPRDSLDYYSEALTVLGEGFDAVFQLETDKTEARANGVQHYRFASTEELCAELNRRATEKARRFDSQWW